MIPKRVCAVYFSATETTKKMVSHIAAALAVRWGVAVETTDFTPPAVRQSPLSFCADDLVVIGTPVYAGRVPNVLLPYLKEKLSGNGALCISVVLFGNRAYDDALIELREIMEGDGLHTVAAGAFVGEHAFSRTLGAHRPDAEDFVLADQLAKSAAQRIEAMARAPATPVAVRGELPLRPYYTPRDRAGNPVNILKVKPRTDPEKCTQCGLCAALCPMGSIDASDAANITGVCIKCCACVKRCPTGAKYYDDERYLYHQHELEAGFARRADCELF